MKKCPYCAEKVPNASKNCPYCDESLEEKSSYSKQDDLTIKIPNASIFLYIGYVVLHLFFLFVILSIYDSIYDTFEYFCISLLLFICVNINIFFRSWKREKTKSLA